MTDKPVNSDVGARIPDWATARAEIIPRLRPGDFAGCAWLEKGKHPRYPVPAFNAHAISHWHVRAVRDGAFLALEEARTAQGELANILLAVANALDLLTVEADTLCGAIYAQGMGGAGFVRGRLVCVPQANDDDFDTEEKTIAELQDIVAGLPQQTARALRDVADGVNRLADGYTAIGKTVNEIDRHTRPDKSRPDDKEVTQSDAARILTDAGYGVSMRQIQNWERYINTNGASGTRPPEGYRIELRAEVLTFQRWAQSVASHKRMKNALRQRRQRAHKTNA